MLALAALRHSDHDFSLGVSCFKVPERFSSLIQWVASIDNRRNAPGLKQLLPERQILLRWVLHVLLLRIFCLYTRKRFPSNVEFLLLTLE
jgi:hypothetical protein